MIPQDATIKGLEPKTTGTDGAGLRILIIHTRWNTAVVSKLVAGCTEQLLASGVASSDIHTVDVPGAYELPFAAKTLLSKGKYDACIPIGVLIKGSTMHFEYIADAVSNGLMRVGLDGNVPVIFGVLTCLTEEQALLRAGIKTTNSENAHNHGIDWANAAVEMALLSK